MPSNNTSAKSDNIQFLFPRDPELALYALATLQSSVRHYSMAMERRSVAANAPESVREPKFHVACDPTFWYLFEDSFPEGTVLVVDSPRVLEDDMLVDLREARINAFSLSRGYSTQWIMGQLAGTRPQMVPEIKNTFKPTRARLAYVDSGVMSPDFTLGPGRLYRYSSPGAKPSLERMVDTVSNADFVVSQQGFITVLSVALGIPTVEVTRDASHRPFLALSHYVQVSRMRPQTFFHESLIRGIEWAGIVSTPRSDAQLAVAP